MRKISEMLKTKKWFIGAECPYCKSQISLTERQVIVNPNGTFWETYARCVKCGEEFILEGL